jgi:hypothetical protein
VDAENVRVWFSWKKVGLNLLKVGSATINGSILTLDILQKPMIQRTGKKRQRTYFIKREKKAKEANRVMSPAEQLLAMFN